MGQRLLRNWTYPRSPARAGLSGPPSGASRGWSRSVVRRPVPDVIGDVRRTTTTWAQATLAVRAGRNEYGIPNEEYGSQIARPSGRLVFSPGGLTVRLGHPAALIPPSVFRIHYSVFVLPCARRGAADPAEALTAGLPRRDSAELQTVGCSLARRGAGRCCGWGRTSATRCLYMCCVDPCLHRGPARAQHSSRTCSRNCTHLC